MEPTPFGNQLPWIRFWRPRSASGEAFDSSEFLSCPAEAIDSGINSEETELSKVVPEIGPLILCGEPGLGKSTELGNLVELLQTSKRAEECLVITQARAHDSFSDLRTWLSTSPEWMRWRNSTERMTLVIDGIDEGMLRIPLFVLNLTEFIRNEPTSRIRLILCCRSAEWPDGEGRALIALWAESTLPIFELRQLRREDAKVAAEEYGHDGKAFLKAVDDSGVVSLAARPITLLFLLDEFENDRFKTTSQRELYENGCKRFCDESNAARVILGRNQPSNFATSEEKLTSAKRLATLFLLGGKSALHCPSNSLERTPTSALRLSDALRDQDGLTENSLIGALRTGLFTSQRSNLFVFTHQTFAECLAGQALAELPMEQLKVMLCARDSRGEHVIPQLAELASWIAGYREEFFEFLILIDSSVLLRSDVSMVGGAIKSRLVARILELAEKDEFFDDSKYSRFWRGLDYPELPEQIGAVISNRNASLMARRVAASIAEECRRPELIKVLRGVLDDHNAEEWLRKSAAEALCRSMPEDRLSELEPLAKQEVGPDPNYSICGYALRRLVPSRWSVAQALPWFKMLPNKRHYGSYHSTLEYHLPLHVVDTDLVPALQALQRWKTSFASTGHRRKFSITILLRSLGKIDDPEIQKQLVKLWRVKSRNYRDFFSEGRRNKTGLEEASDESRLKWVAAILNHPQIDADKDAYQIAGETYKLLGPDDIGWLLGKLPNQPKQRLSMWVRTFEILRWNESSLARYWDLFIETLKISPELRAAFAWFKPIELNSPEARSMKARWLVHERNMGRRQRKRLKPDHEAEIVSDLAAIRNGREGGFANLCYPLSASPGQTLYYEPLSRDIAKYPGWITASEDRRAEIKQAARTFLIKCSDGYDELGHRTNYSDLGLVAICLLREELENNPHLQQAILHKWIDAITGDSRSDTDCGRELFALAYRLNPERTIEGWIREMQKDSEQHGYLFAIRHAASCFDAKLINAAVLFIESRLDPKSIKSGIHELNYLDPIAASGLAARLIERFSHENELDSEILDAAIIGGLDVASAEAWLKAYPILVDDEERATRVLLEASHDLISDGGKLAHELSEEQLGDFYLMLCRSFPISEDPETGTGWVSPRQSVVRVRSSVLTELSSRANESACEQLLKLARLLPDEATWILWRYQSTLEATRRSEWQPAGTTELTAMVANGLRRFIRNEDDLLEIVLESLNLLQKHLKGDDLPAVEELWQWDGGGLKRHNFRHKDEEAVSDYVARWLRDKIGPLSSVVVNREVQPDRGKKTDILVQAWTRTQPGRRRTERPISVTIEVKGCWNGEIETAAKDQLLADYLIPFNRTHGIFVVAWFHSPHHAKVGKGQTSKLRFADIVEARNVLGGFVAQAKLSSFRIEPFVLDVRLT